MSKFLMLECNRLNSQENYKGIDEEQDIYKNKWTNNVNSYGIEVQPGDIIELNSSSINTRGTIENAIEFVGQESPTKQGFVDNKLGLELGYYLNDTRSYNYKLPLKNSTTAVNQSSQQPSDQYTNAIYLLNRSLGEVFLSYDDGINPLDQDAVMPVYTRLDCKITQAGSGFEVGTTYSPVYKDTQNPGPGTGIGIVVTDIENIGTTLGAVTKFKVTVVGSGYEPGNLLKVTSPQSGGTDFEFIINSYINPNTYTKYSPKVTGKRYFPPNPEFTGPAVIPISIPDDPGGNFDLSKANAVYSQRFSDVQLEIETGLNTPQNISDVLSKKLKQTNKIDQYNQSPYFEPTDNFRMPRVIDNLPNQVRPVTIETQTYKLNAVNYLADTSPVEGRSYIDSRKIYYQSICYENPQKLQALQWSRQLFYNIDLDDPQNELSSGDSPGIEIGDYDRQEVGDLGLNCCLMQNLPGYDTPNDPVVGTIKLEKGDFILTNVYFTEKNIKTIASSLKLGERYYGDLNKRADPDSQDYKDNLGIAMDIGLYVDQLSQMKELDPGEQHQRKRFLSFYEYNVYNPTPANNYIDVDFQNPCKGTQDDPFFEGEFENDGEQLSQLVIKSRFNESIVNRNSNAYQKLYNLISEAPLGSRFAVTGTQDEVFNNSYVDPIDNVTRSTEDLIQMARDADLAAIPVFPVGASNNFALHGGRPYIAFVSKLKTATDYTQEFNPKTFENWIIDSNNCVYGMQLGWDCSFFRNPAIQMVNVRGDTFSDQAPALYLGASDMSFDFDTDFSRFTISGMNTPMTIGNGFNYNEFAADIVNDPSINPEQTAALFGTTMGIQGYIPTSGSVTVDYFNLIPEPNTYIDSYSGVVINGVILYDKQDNAYGYGIGDPRLNNSLISGTMLSKMGFDIFDILPRLGTIQTPYNPISSSITTANLKTYLDAFRTQNRPITTGLFISSPEIQATGLNTLFQPTYDINIPSVYQTQPDAEQGSIVASNLPTKLDFPYLIVHSSLCATNVDTEYYGSKTGKSKINAIGVITRNYNQGDFFYGLGQTYYYTAVKKFVLTEITTEILLPDGTRPTLDPASAVIYKITKPLSIPVPIAVEQAQKEVQKKKRQS